MFLNQLPQTIPLASFVIISQRRFSKLLLMMILNMHLLRIFLMILMRNLFCSCNSNHYLCLVKASPTDPLLSNHGAQCPIIADSGANYHMFKDKELVHSLTPENGKVILGDWKTALEIKGVHIA
jgi:hypothetical protein